MLQRNIKRLAANWHRYMPRRFTVWCSCGIQSAHYAWLNTLILGLNLMLGGSIGYQVEDPDDPEFLEQLAQGIYQSLNAYSSLSIEQLEYILEIVYPFYINYIENNRISSPDIRSFSVGNSRALIDEDTYTITLRMPKDKWATAEENAVITAEKWVLVEKYAGDLANGVAYYKATPYEAGSGVLYDGKTTGLTDGILEKTNNMTVGMDGGKDLSQIWTVRLEEGEPFNQVTDFSVTTSDGVIRHADIDEPNKTITLNLPVGTDLTAITPEIMHTGSRTNMDGETQDFTESRHLTVYNDAYDLETTYTVTITAKPSSEAEILSYQIDGIVGTISGNSISITVPYATDLSNVSVEISCSEFATLQAPESLHDGENTYTVISQDKSKSITYTVTISRAAAATGNQILAFCYGSSEGVINNTNGTIHLTLPRGSSSTFAPSIEISPFATVSPASGQVQDFSSPVQYTVTSQTGVRNNYIVTVEIEETAEPNPYENDMMTLVKNIVDRYRAGPTTDDWDWMNLGFYENVERHSAEDLPSGFDIYATMKQFDRTAATGMTTGARILMALTALGINATDLTPYGDGTTPITIASGDAISNFVAEIYNFSGSYTINGPVYALIALDMGNYTIPENAVWTREKLLDAILSHQYGSDNFGLDMVGMMMQAIAPYQTDEIYGDRVQEKLDEGLSIILGETTVSGVDGMRPDYTFFSTGTVNSEVASQMICALSAMGIDCYTDPRFTNGTISVLSQFLSFANVSEGYFNHTAETPNDHMATYQGCYATQWYLAFLENGGQGNPCYFYYQRFDFSTQLSDAANILSFTLDGKEGQIEEDTDGDNHYIRVTLPAGSPLNNISPVLELSPGATLYSPELPTSVSEGVMTPFTVIAEDGATRKTYYLVVTYSDEMEASGTELLIDSITLENRNQMEISILGREVTQDADGVTEILLTVNAGNDVTALRISAEISYRATASPALDGRSDMDLSDWTTFTVTAEDGTTAQYRIKVQARRQASISAFSLTINGRTYQGEIDNEANTITVSGVDDSNLTTTRFSPSITLGEGTTICSPLAGAPQDFSAPVTYTVSGTDVVSRTYTVRVTDTSGNLISSSGGGTTTPGSAAITAFRVLDVDGEIDQTAGTIVVRLPYGTNVSAVTPTVTISTGAVVSPVSGETVNLNGVVPYTVTLGTESRTYYVSVIFVRTTSQQLWDDLAGEETVRQHQVSRDPNGLPGGWRP